MEQSPNDYDDDEAPIQWLTRVLLSIAAAAVLTAVAVWISA